jgi:hypothetical protein
MLEIGRCQTSSMVTTLASITFMRMTCRGGSDLENKKISGPWDHLFKKDLGNSSLFHVDKNCPELSNEDWASDDDIPRVAMTIKNNTEQSTDLWVSAELKAYAAECGSQIQTIKVDGEDLDAALYDLVLCSSRDFDGTAKEINGRQAQTLVKCVQDTTTHVPSIQESRVFRLALSKFRMTSEARGIFISQIHKAASSQATASAASRPALPNSTGLALARSSAPTAAASVPPKNPSAPPLDTGPPIPAPPPPPSADAAAASSDLARLGRRLKRAVAAEDVAAAAQALRRLRRAQLPDGERPPRLLLRLVAVRARAARPARRARALAAPPRAHPPAPTRASLWRRPAPRRR